MERISRSSPPEEISPERLRYLARRVWRLGERGLFEFLAGAPLVERLERYARLEADYGDFVRALGGDRLRPPIVVVDKEREDAA